MNTHEIKEIDGKMVEVPVENATADEISWFEPDSEEDVKGYSSIIELHGKRFWILALSRHQNKKVDERLKVIQSKARELNRETRKANDAAAAEKAEKLSREIPELTRANEEQVLLKTLRFWELSGKREAVKPEQVKKLYRSHQSELYDRIMQKSRMGRSEGNF